jgi:apolipoprotein N-acyltransferase
MNAITKQGFVTWWGKIIALIAGMLLPLSFAPFHYYPLAIISLALLFISWQGVSAAQAALRGFLFGLGFFGVGVSWVYVAIHDFGNASLPLAVLLTGLFVAFLSSYLAFIGWAVKKISGDILSNVDFVFLLPLAWLIFEYFKGWFLTGFPWLEVGAGQIDGPLSGYTSIIGVLGVSLLTALSAGLLAAAWQAKRISLLISVIVIWTVGYFLKPVLWTLPIDKAIKVTIVQGNIPQQIKWDPEQLFKTLAIYHARSEQHWDSDLIVWPENAVPVFYQQVKEFYLDPLAELAQANQTDILVGLPVRNEAKNQYYNSMMSLGAQQGFYYKSHLVPFGDYVPLEWLRGIIAFFDLPMSSFSAGPVSGQLLHAADQLIGTSICYEDAFSREVLRTVPEASLLVNATNNAWYGDSFAPHQHLQISQNRALETGRPIIRATTNGVSAFIDFKGNIQKQTAQFKEAVLTANVQPRQGATPYVASGQLPLYLFSLFMLLAWIYYRRVE